MSIVEISDVQNSNRPRDIVDGDGAVACDVIGEVNHITRKSTGDDRIGRPIGSSIPVAISIGDPIAVGAIDATYS